MLLSRQVVNRLFQLYKYNTGKNRGENAEFKYLYFHFAFAPGLRHSLLALTEGSKLSASTFAQSDVGKWRCYYSIPHLVMQLYSKTIFSLLSCLTELGPRLKDSLPSFRHPNSASLPKLFFSSFIEVWPCFSFINSIELIYRPPFLAASPAAPAASPAALPASRPALAVALGPPGGFIELSAPEHSFFRHLRALSRASFLSAHFEEHSLSCEGIAC